MLQRTCSHCGKRNRIPARYAVAVGKCGDCKHALPPPSTPIDVDSVAMFNEIIEQTPVPVLVDFWAAWCGPCRMAAPEVARVAQHQSGQALVLKVDTEALPSLAAQYQVRSIPNFAVFAHGKLVRQQAGLRNHRELEAWLASAQTSAA